MFKRILVSLSISALLLSHRPAAAYSNLDVSASGFVSNAIVITIHNADSASETARVTVTVQLSGGVEQTLTSSNVTIEGGSTVSVVLLASQTIVGIGDDPDPIPPSP